MTGLHSEMPPEGHETSREARFRGCNSPLRWRALNRPTRGKGAAVEKRKHEAKRDDLVSEVRPKAIGTLVSANQARKRAKTLTVHLLCAIA
jgi:hypothetical protein